MRNTPNLTDLQSSNQELLDENTDQRDKLVAMEDAAKVRQEQLQTLSAAIRVGFWEWDEATKKAAYFSKEMADIFGMGLDSLYEKCQCEEDFFSFIHPDDLDHYIDNLSNILSPEHPRGLAHVFDYRIVRPNGEVRNVRELEYGIQEEGGVITRSFGAIQDMTEQVSMRKNIEESAAKLKLAARTAKLGYWHYDEVALKYLDISEEYAAIHGYTVPEYLDRFQHFEDDMSTVHPEDKEALYEAYELAKGKQDFVYRTQHKDGHWIHVREIATDILDEAGNCIESIGTLQDVTEQKKAEQSLRESRDSLEAVVEERTKQLADTIKRLEQEIEERKNISSELENQNAELERFAYTVSHDLKAPLVTIKGFAGLLGKDIDAKDMDHVKSDLKHINRAADTMDALLNNLLELSRIGRVMGDPVTCDLTEITKQAIELCEAKVDKLGVEIVIEDMPKVYGDKKRLVEVYLNLIENAIKFMGEQKSPRIKIGAVEKDGVTCCFVQDNGAGIAAEYRKQIFGLFERLNADVEGTGVGLALAKRIIEAHGGEVWAESEGLGLGSKFSFTLPKP
jgi:PAS domain S-box-containing protein